MLILMSVQAGRDGLPNSEVGRYANRALDEIAELPASTERDKLRAYC
jgi:hypothetical protein